MARKIIVSKTAFRDIDIGVEYYKQQQNGLGRRFESLIHITFKKIQKFPHSASYAYENVRYKVADDFPYIILYEFDDVNIYILRVFNTHLSPDKI
jgi:plasmid stabilization system protein ParE